MTYALVLPSVPWAVVQVQAPVQAVKSQLVCREVCVWLFPMHHLPLPSTLMTCLAPAARIPLMAAWFRETTNAVGMVLYLYYHNQSNVRLSSPV